MATKKLKSRAGFTLAETLLAVTILLLVSTIVATGMPAAKDAYEKVVLASNAEVLLSTAVSTLRDELGTAWKVEKLADNSGVSYFSADTGYRTKLYKDTNGKICLEEYSETTKTEELLKINNSLTSVQKRELVFQASDGTELTLTCSGITLDPATKTVRISGLCVKKKDSAQSDPPLAEWKKGNADGDKELPIPVFSVINPTQAEQTQNG